MTRHDRIHLARLVLLLEEPSDDAPLSHLNLLRLNTVRTPATLELIYALTWCCP